MLIAIRRCTKKSKQNTAENCKYYFEKSEGNTGRDCRAIEWYFKNKMNDGTIEAFEGMSLIQWMEDNRICFLKEFGCNENHYDPYLGGTVPKFRDEKVMWF